MPIGAAMADVERILYVDGDEARESQVRRAFAKAGFRGNLVTRRDAAGAIEFLSEAATRDELPQIMLSVFDGEQSGGRGLLKWRQNEPRWRATPLILLAPSFMPDDVQEAYTLGASSFIVMPATISQLEDTVARLLHFWEICAIPGDRLRLR